MAEALRNGNPHMKGRALTGPENFEQIPQLAARGLRRIALFKDTLDERLKTRDYIAIDGFSYADLSAFVFCDFFRVVKMRVDDAHPHLKSWYERIGARPSAQL